MTVYSFNRGIGWASSGVEYAQAYRASVLRRLGIPIKFIFTDMFRLENIETLTCNLGFQDSEILWLYSFFTDFPIAPCKVTAEVIEKKLPAGERKAESIEGSVYYRYSSFPLTVRVFPAKGGGVQRVEYAYSGRLIRTDFYSCAKLFSEYYNLKDGKSVPSHRRFFNLDGSEAYTELIEPQRSVFRFPDRIFYSKEELIAELVRQLSLGDDDIALIDRSTELDQAVIRNAGKARLGVVVHAEHYNAARSDEDYLLWNNYYDYTFTNADKIDFFLVSTLAQKRVLAEQFSRYCARSPRIEAIPVGSLDRLTVPVRSRGCHSFITASRLAAEKHVDWLVSAVIAAREQVPDLSLDIFGRGGAEAALKKQIEEHNASQYIRLCGHHELREIYPRYYGYLSASLSEGFGLTLMEAVGAGLLMAGFDVHYGCQTFIKDGENGYLIPVSGEEDPSELIAALREAILSLCTLSGEDSARFSRCSHELARPFLTVSVEEAWRRLICPDGFGQWREEVRP